MVVGANSEYMILPIRVFSLLKQAKSLWDVTYDEYKRGRIVRISSKELWIALLIHCTAILYTPDWLLLGSDRVHQTEPRHIVSKNRRRQLQNVPYLQRHLRRRRGCLDDHRRQHDCIHVRKPSLSSRPYMDRPARKIPDVPGHDKV